MQGNYQVATKTYRSRSPISLIQNMLSDACQVLPELSSEIGPMVFSEIELVSTIQFSIRRANNADNLGRMTLLEPWSTKGSEIEGYHWFVTREGYGFQWIIEKSDERDWKATVRITNNEGEFDARSELLWALGKSGFSLPIEVDKQYFDNLAKVSSLNHHIKSMAIEEAGLNLAIPTFKSQAKYDLFEKELLRYYNRVKYRNKKAK